MQKRGFSLVELLIALLIMAVVAAIAIALFGGILNSSKVSADAEAQQIVKKSLTAYMSSSNDTGLSMLGGTTVTCDALIHELTCRFTIKNDSSGKKTSILYSGSSLPTGYTWPTVAVTEPSIQNGDYGPFLDINKRLFPISDKTMNRWQIKVHSVSQVIDIQATSAAVNVEIVSD